MDSLYARYAQQFKALSDPNRLMIVDMLSCGELCACILLAGFNITQPTLSYHMKSLCDCNLVNARKEGKWVYYSLNDATFRELRRVFGEVTTGKDTCACHRFTDKEVCCK